MSVRSWLLLLLGVLVLALSVPSFAASSRMPYGSYLTRPISSVQDLGNLQKLDKVAMLRYSRHFGMEPSALAEYFRTNLTLKGLSKSGNYTVYFIAKNGRALAHTKWLKAGTKVFVASNGQPILRLDCGNPFTKLLPNPIVKVKPALQETKPPVAVEPPAPPPDMKPTAPPVPTTVAEVTQPTPPVETKVLDAPPTTLPAPAPAPSPTPIVSSGGARWLMPALLGLGAAGALGGGGGSPPVPEPASMLVLGLGSLGMLYRRRMTRRR